MKALERIGLVTSWLCFVSAVIVFIFIKENKDKDITMAEILYHGYCAIRKSFF